MLGLEVARKARRAEVVRDGTHNQSMASVRAQRKPVDPLGRARSVGT